MAKCEPGCTCGRHRGQAGNRSQARRVYDVQHKRVSKQRGPARFHSCVKCGTAAQEWAYVHETDPDCTDNYQPMCRTCHRNYDGWPEMISEAQRRRWAALSPEERSAYFAGHEEAISEGLKRMWAERTPEQRAEIARKSGISQKGKTVSEETRARISASKREASARRGAADE